jgi:hypothetical protein
MSLLFVVVVFRDYPEASFPLVASRGSAPNWGTGRPRVLFQHKDRKGPVGVLWGPRGGAPGGSLVSPRCIWGGQRATTGVVPPIGTPCGFWGGPPAPPFLQVLMGILFFLPPCAAAPPKMAPPGAPPGGRLLTGCVALGVGAPAGAPRGVPPREGPPDPPRGPRGPTATPPGAPPGPASGPRPPIGGAPPRGDEGRGYIFSKKHTKHQKNQGETWSDRPQKRGKNTHKGLKLGPFWAPLQGAHPVRFWGGPPAPPIDHC